MNGQPPRSRRMAGRASRARVPWRRMPDAEAAAPDNRRHRVMVVDDHDLFRSGLRRLLDEHEGLDVVGEARRGDEAVQRAAELKPDVVVMDINMPGMSGVEATRGVLQAAPDSAVLMLTVTSDENAVLDAVLAGASGYLLKDAKLPEIVRGIQAAAAGQSLIAPSVAGELLARLRRHGAPDAQPTPPPAAPDLTPRELEVLRLVVAGCDNGEIGQRLHLSASTIKHHVSNTLEKLGVENRIQAAVMAVRLGLVDEPAA
jgi:DNA-binding NarL/FixJ family response regulator